MIILDRKQYSVIPKQEKKDVPIDNRKERQKIYNTKRWQKLRLSYLYANFLCESCGKDF